MSELNQEMLFAACRAIYEMAGENYLLPPLIRDAGSLEAQPSYRYNCPIGDDELHFLVELDEAYADRNALAHSKLPLKFRVELRDPNFKERTVPLPEYEKYELIRAFLLGAKIPISAEKINEHLPFQLSVQLSSTFFMDCGELLEDPADCLAKVVCDDVGRKLYARSREFFANPQQGLAVWSEQAAQSLFGEARLPPYAFWPEFTSVPAPVTAAAEPVRPLHQRYAMAATIAFGLLGAGILALNFESRSEALTPAGRVASSAATTLAALLPQQTVAVSAEPSDTFDPFRPSPTSAAQQPLEGTRPRDAVLDQAMASPALVAVSDFVQIPTLPGQHDCTTCGGEPTEQMAFLMAPPPVLQAEDVPLPPARPKLAFAAGRKGNKLAPKSAKPEPPMGPLEFTQNALVSIGGVVQGIGRIPDELSKAKKRLQGLLPTTG